jgi:radical SAM superfamily enzyme YgiQ (UPF0313 family)
MIKNKFDFTWDAPNGIRADTLDETLIRKSKKAGCIRMVIAPESGDQDTVDNIIGKHLDLNKVVEAARLCKKYKIPLHAFYVIGFPGETKEKIRKTLDFAAMLMDKFDVIPAFMMANPLFGTRLYEECKEKGYLTKDISPEDIMLGSIVGAEGLIKTPDFTPEYLKKVLQKFYQKALLKNFLKPRYVIEKLIEDPHRSLERAIKLFRLSKG